MLRERIVWIVALLLVGGVAFFSGQTIGVRAGEQNRALAGQQFLSQRGGPAGGQAGGQAGGAGGFARGGNGGGTAGMVSDVSGNTITITTRANQTLKIQLAANGTVRKQVDGQLSDIKAGDQIVAIGAQSGDIFQATSIQLGGAFGGAFGGQGGGQRGNQNGGQNGGGQNGGQNGGTTNPTPSQ